MDTLPDFDTLMRLAQNDPEQLEALRQRLIEQTITQATESNQARLYALQSKIEHTLALSPNPYHRMLTANKMMQDQLRTLATVLNQPDQYLEHKAPVLPFADNHTQRSTR